MALGPRGHVPRPPRHPRPPAPVRAGLTWAARHAADGAASRAFWVGGRPMAQQPLRESLGAPGAGGKESGRRGPAPAAPYPPLASAPPPPPGAAPPRPVLPPGEDPPPRSGYRRVAATAAPVFPPCLAAPRSPLSTSGAGPPPCPPHTSRDRSFGPSGQLSHLQRENSPRDLTPPGLTSGGPRVCTPHSPTGPHPTPSRPIRFRAPSHALIRLGSHRRDPRPIRLRQR